jgi:hypothetical protein
MAWWETNKRGINGEVVKIPQKFTPRVGHFEALSISLSG